MTKSVSTLLKTVDSNASVDDILAGLGRLQAYTRQTVKAGIDPEQRDAVEDAEVDGKNAGLTEKQVIETIDEIRTQLTMLAEHYNLVLIKLTRFENQADDQLFADLDGVLERTIIDYQTAYEATTTYTEDWFSEALLSDRAKVQLADTILQKVRQFCPSNLKTLELISGRDPETMKLIQAPKLIRP